MLCPKCGSNDVKTEQKQLSNLSVKVKRGNGCLWWLLLGWIYLIYIAFVWVVKLTYFACVGWWVKIIQKKKQEKESKAVIHICQNCGNKWETK